MGNKCCEAVVEPAIPDQIPLFKDFENHEWPEEDSYIHEWIKQNAISESQELKEKAPMKHKEKNQYFLGNLHEGIPYGRGIFYQPDTILIDGVYENGQIQGNAKISQLGKKIQYEGQVRAGKANGHGFLINKEAKYKFEGDWEDSKPKVGKLLFEDDPNVQQIEITDYQHQIVNIVYKDTKRYQGQVQPESFVPNGKGKVIFPKQSNKNFYQGYWRGGFMEGKGKYVWKDGSYYQGDYRDGKKQGYGKFYFTSGKYYSGYWKNGKQNGLGTFYDALGVQLKQGQWVQGKLTQPMQKEEYLRQSQLKAAISQNLQNNEEKVLSQRNEEINKGQNNLQMEPNNQNKNLSQQEKLELKKDDKDREINQKQQKNNSQKNKVQEKQESEKKSQEKNLQQLDNGGIKNKNNEVQQQKYPQIAKEDNKQEEKQQKKDEEAEKKPQNISSEKN